MPTIAELFNLAVAYHKKGEFRHAEELYRQVLRADPINVNALSNLGAALQATGRGNEAIPCFQEAVRLNPAHVGALNNLGIAYDGHGQHTQAAECYRAALRSHPDFVEALKNLGGSLLRQGQPAEAIPYLRQALALDPKHADALNSLGNALKEQGRLAEGIECFRQALRINPRHGNAHNNLGIALVRDLQFAEGIECFQQAVRLNPQSADALNNLGNALNSQGRQAEAAKALRQALHIDPNFADAHNHLGATLFETGQYADAAECFRQALRVKPDHKTALYNRSLLHLLQGNLAEGWPDYEQRWGRTGMVPRVFQEPRWDGSPLHGKTILIYAEQGLGDTIQFIRYARMVKQRGGRVLLECQPALLRVLEGVEGVDQLLPAGQADWPAFDVQCALVSLPGIFGTTLSTIPCEVPYLRVASNLVEQWGHKLRAAMGGTAEFSIGIVWQGNPAKVDDRYRSAPLAAFAPVAKVPGVRLVSLQVGPGREQLAKAPFPVYDLGAGFDPSSLHDLAGVLPSLDLVVTVDTVVAHLAGALDLPVWMALPYVPDWRWLLERTESPWYPSVRLFRQGSPGDCAGVFERIAAGVLSLTRGFSC